MALIVEDGTGLANSEAYISIADATAYLAARGSGDAWDLIDDKEAALRKGADYMTQMYRPRWRGYRASSAQAMDWPRAEVPMIDVDGYYANTIVPNEIKYANALLALKTASVELLPDDTQKVIEKSVGPITVKYDPNADPQRRFSAVEALLEPFCSGGSNMVALGRS
jgi:hypothetical protein